MKNPNPDPKARYEVPVWNQDVKLYEDYQVGEIDRSLRRTVSEGEVMLFNSLVLNFIPMSVMIFGLAKRDSSSVASCQVRWSLVTA